MANAREVLPSRSVLTMEICRARVDEKGEAVKNANGCFIKGGPTGIFVTEKRGEWGAGYSDPLRNGVWEYTRFRPEGTTVVDGDTKPRFQCFKPMSGLDSVFTFLQLAAASK